MTRIISFFTALLTAVTAFLRPIWFMNDFSFDIDAGKLSGEIANLASNVNVWYMGTQFVDPRPNEENNIFDFVEYVQLMQCSGGSVDRDLFKDPLDRSVLDDYDFSLLLDNCAGIIALGAKPLLKLGSVPLKYSSKTLGDEVFGCNVYPPDDYDVYYDYIAALADALVGRFGKEEVLSWRFGVMTEFENSDWWQAPDGSPESAAEEYCRLYDCTVAALQDVIGKDVVVGAHAMTVTEGLWDEEIFIRHCAEGVNTRTGEKGARLCYLSSSFYDVKTGRYTSGLTPAGCVEHLRSTAEKYGLTGLWYGFDEGRILCGLNSGKDSDQLNSRTMGDTWQAAYDARLFKSLIDCGAEYFSQWYYFSDGLRDGIPTVCYHVARLVSEYAGSKKAEVKRGFTGHIIGGEVDAQAAYNEEENALRAFVYNFKNSLDYKRSADVKLRIKLPEKLRGRLRVTVYTVDDDCNYYDEWSEDRVRYSIGNDCFVWSPDDACVTLLNDPRGRAVFDENRPRYAECAKLVPTTFETDGSEGKAVIPLRLEPNTAVFYKIELA